MATLARSISRADRWSVEHRFFAGVAVALLLVTFVGFAPSYYLSRFTAAPALPVLVHVHGVVFTLWMLLYAAQTGLVVTRNVRVHRLVGAGGAVLAILVVVLGVTVAIATAREVRLAPPGLIRRPPLIYPISAITVFGALCAAAIALRHRAPYHKRLMLLATVSVATTPLARIGRMAGAPLPPPISGMILSDLFVLALVVFDLKTRKRLHPITLWVGSAFVLSQPLRILLGETAVWRSLARSLTA